MNQKQLSNIALSLPEVTEEPHFDRTSFRVRGKIFATVLPGDSFLNVMVGETGREPALATYPDAVAKLFWGKKVAGLRVDLRRADAALIEDLLEQAWKEKAPKSLHGQLAGDG